MNLNAEELDLILSALMARKRNLPDLIKAWGVDSHRGKELQRQLDNIPELAKRIVEGLVDARCQLAVLSSAAGEAAKVLRAS